MAAKGKIEKDFDPVGNECPSIDKGALPWENTGIGGGSVNPADKVAMTPGESASNVAEQLNYNKKQPYGEGGSGYTGADN